MVESNANATDPPGTEQKPAAAWERFRGIFRALVNRRTLLVALQILVWIVRIVRAYRRLRGDL